jgi:rubrerythrin
MVTLMVSRQNEDVVKNLLDAFDAEMNANVRYKAFALKAEQDGLLGAASLFRAAARAEEIHANNHARVIRQMGGEAHANLLPVKIRSTLDNLKSALGGERHEAEKFYPALMNEATSRLDTSAARTFNWAIEAEKTHIKLYGDAVAVVEAGKPGAWTQKALDFYVCTLCGYTAKSAEAENCPACNFLWERFEVIR